MQRSELQVRNHYPRTSGSANPPPPPPPLKDLPVCGSAFSLNDLHATSLASSGRLFIASDHLPIRSRRRVTCEPTAGNKSKRVSAQAFRPTQEQVTRTDDLLNRGSCGVGVRCLELTTEDADATGLVEVTGVHMMYTITRGPSKLVTQRRTGEWF